MAAQCARPPGTIEGRPHWLAFLPIPTHHGCLSVLVVVFTASLIGPTVKVPGWKDAQEADPSTENQGGETKRIGAATWNSRGARRLSPVNGMVQRRRGPTPSVRAPVNVTSSYRRVNPQNRRRTVREDCYMPRYSGGRLHEVFRCASFRV